MNSMFEHISILFISFYVSAFQLFYVSYILIIHIHKRWKISMNKYQNPYYIYEQFIAGCLFIFLLSFFLSLLFFLISSTSASSLFCPYIPRITMLRYDINRWVPNEWQSVYVWDRRYGKRKFLVCTVLLFHSLYMSIPYFIFPGFFYVLPYLVSPNYSQIDLLLFPTIW